MHSSSRICWRLQAAPKTTRLGTEIFLWIPCACHKHKVLSKHDGTLKTPAVCDGHVQLMPLALKTLRFRARQDVLFVSEPRGPWMSICRDYRTGSSPSLEGEIAVAVRHLPSLVLLIRRMVEFRRLHDLSCTGSLSEARPCCHIAGMDCIPSMAAPACVRLPILHSRCDSQAANISKVRSPRASA